MNRLWGSSGPAPKAPTLDQQLAKNTEEISRLDVQIRECDARLAELQRQRSSHPKGSPGYTRFFQRMKPILERRRMLEQQQQNKWAQESNLFQVQSTIATVQNSAASVAAMKATSKELKKQLRGVDVDKIERLQDEMADLVDMGNELSEALGRSYDIPEDIDEAELDAELESLALDNPLGAESETSGALPSFMQDEVPDFIDAAPQVDSGKVQEAAR